MFLTENQLSKFFSFFAPSQLSKRSVPPGTVLHSDQTSNEIQLVVSGYCRILDPSSQFGSLTLLRAQAPYLCGALYLVDNSLVEHVVASTECEVISLPSPYNSSFINYIHDLYSQSLSPCELPRIQSVVKSSSLDIPADQQTPSSYLRNWIILSADDLLEVSSDALFIYADQSRKGFTYGQILSLATLKQFFLDSSPRLVTWSDNRRSIFATPAAIDQHDLSASDSTSKSLASIVDTISLDTNLVDTFGSSSSSSAQRVNQLGFEPVVSSDNERVFDSILQMICKHYSLPIRRDTLRKASSFLTSSKGDVTPDKLVSVFDRLNLIARVVTCRSDNYSRLPVPSIAFNQNKVPILVVDSTSKGLLCVNPLQGIETLFASDLSHNDDTTLSVVSVATGPSTPKSVFGFGWLLPYLKFYKFQFAEVFVASFITQLFALATPLLFQQIIDRVIGQGSSGALGGFAALMVIFMLLELAFSSLRTFQFMEISNRIDINIGSSIISRLLRLNARFFEKRPVGELSSRLNELDKIRSFITGTALTVVLDALFALLYFGVMFFYSPLLAGIILGSIPLLLLIILGLTPLKQRLIRERAEAHAKTNSYLVEVLNGIQTVKLQNSELTARRRWEDRHLDDINKGFRAVIANTASSNVLQLVNKTTNILVITVGSWLVLQNQLTLGGLIAFRIISGYVTQPILRLASTWNSFQEVSLSVERLGDVINQPSETSPYESTNIEMPEIEGHVSFDEVSFGYDNTEKLQLSGVSLDFPRGSFNGVVGQSGCGKSTLLKLIPRLYVPSNGRISVDGLDVSKVELYSLRRQIGYVPQDCLLFEGSIYANIAVADPEAETEDVVEAAKLACAHDFIMSLPYGYSTPLGEKGAGLSGGQRQRISLARMLLQRPNLVILDEATSALDVDTEQQVVSNLRTRLANQTIIMITHRLSTLKQADQIVMMHNGRIDSKGTHDQLMAMSGRYFVMYNQQVGL